MAIAILVELSPGSQLMQTNGIQNLKGYYFLYSLFNLENFKL
jgi:hypothetical protein